MRRAVFFVGIALALSSFDMVAQQKPRGGRTATLAISVADPAGTPIPNVLVTLEGPASRTARTEGGRIALEELPVGRYTLRFEQEGFVMLERELSATACAGSSRPASLRVPEPWIAGCGARDCPGRSCP